MSYRPKVQYATQRCAGDQEEWGAKRGLGVILRHVLVTVSDQLKVIVPCRRSSCSICPRRKSSPNRPSILALGGRVCARTRKSWRSCPTARIRMTEMRGAYSTPLPVVTYTRSGAKEGSYPTVVSGATLIIVAVAPVSNARRNTMLPDGPTISVGMMTRPRCALNE
jgi:hypothetical protein